MNTKRASKLIAALALAAVVLMSLTLLLSTQSSQAQGSNEIYAGSQSPVAISGTNVITSYVFLPLVANEYDPTWVWTEITTPTLTPSPFLSTPLIAIDKQGQVHLFWDTSSSQSQFIYHSYLTAQGWTTPTEVAPSLGSSDTLYPPVVGQDGRIHLLWYNELTYSGPRRLLYSAFDGSQWSAEEEIYRVESPYSLQGMTHLDQAGQIHVTLLSSHVYADIYHTVRRTSGWSTPINIPRPHAISWVWPNQRGDVHLYGYGYPNIMYYSHWHDGQFLVENAQTSGTLSGRDTQLDGLNNLHLFWTADVPVPGGSVRGLHHQCLSDNLQWGEVQVPTGDKAINYPSPLKATDWETRFALVWQELDANQTRMGVWQDCTLSDLKTIPLPSESPWLPNALAISHTPNKICLLVKTLYGSSYRVICVDILR